MIKIGDRVIVKGRVGMIIGETAKNWKIDFVGGDKPELVSKDTYMEIFVPKPNPTPTPNPRPKKRWGWKRWLWTVGIILFVAGAVVLTVINIVK